MNDRDRRESGHLMLISPERVFYAGLLGRPRKRSSGGFNIYAAIRGSLKITEDKSEAVGEVALVPPYLPHSVESEHPSIICLVIEPETVEPLAMDQLSARISGPGAPDIAQRIRQAYDSLRLQQRRGGFTTGQFDQLFFGEALPDRNIDQRIRRSAARLNDFSDFSGGKMTATDCAASVSLSPSRFLHLFKEQTGVSFRAFRAWKRARHLLHFVNEDINLAHLAQDIGYPDSTHFSHSIRRFYGLQPRAIFSGSRDLAIYRSDSGVLDSAGFRQGRP
ncbi:helix-turn-helix domain-containing protein [Bradyrhizobium sp.]|jgi:AraC-like DNA-binding protein|uniref:helix-turn-helix domain-containing protein n=1 Tax=Bradyrhizobium sp. TaxID=376 RepID=UPI003C76920B